MTPQAALSLIVTATSVDEADERARTVAAAWRDDFADVWERAWDDGSASRRYLLWVMERAASSAAASLLVRLVERATTKEEAEPLLASMNRARVPAPRAVIARWLGENVESAAVAAGISGDAELAPLLAAKLDEDGSICQHAALALGAAQHREFTQAIVKRLADVDTFHASAFIVALELMNDASVVPQLLALMKKWRARSWYDLNHALWRLTGREPLLPASDASPKDHARASAAAWERLIHAGPGTPRCENVRSEDPRTLTFDLVDGMGALRIDWEPPTPGSSWARWDRAFYVHDTSTWNLGSTCGTCETVLYRVGFPAQAIAEAAASVRAAVANMTTLDSAALDAIAPYLHVLRTGRYLARLVDWDLVRVERPQDSWLTRRATVRDPNAAVTDDDLCDLRAAHFQTRTVARCVMPDGSTVPTYGEVLPINDLSALDEDVVASWTAAIERGERPAALTMTWVDQRHVQMEHAERFLVSVVLDGHHKLAAYARAQRPARVLALCRIDDSFGPGDGDGAQWLREALDAVIAPSPR